LRAVLSQALDQGARWGLVSRNVAAMTRGPRAKRQEGPTLTREQARALLAGLAGQRDEALYVTMLVLGLRRGEAVGLRWEDVDLERRVLVVRRALEREDGELVAGEVKTAKSRRSLNLPEQLVELLRAHRVKQASERLKLAPAWVDSGHVFTTQLGTPIDPRNCYRDFVRHCEQLAEPSLGEDDRPRPTVVRRERSGAATARTELSKGGVPHIGEHGYLPWSATGAFTTPAGIVSCSQ
jgi:integrase